MYNRLYGGRAAARHPPCVESVNRARALASAAAGFDGDPFADGHPSYDLYGHLMYNYHLGPTCAAVKYDQLSGWVA